MATYAQVIHSEDDSSDANEEELPTELYAHQGYDAESSNEDEAATEVEAQAFFMPELPQELWLHSFAPTEEYTNNFPINKIERELKYCYRAEEYILSCLNIANSFFPWVSSRIFIVQKNMLCDCKTRSMLELDSVLPTVSKGAKGEIFIPLYPYSKTKLFGYLQFDWDNENDIPFADILHFLKLTFSQEAKLIFVSNKQNQAFKERLQNLMIQEDHVSIAAIEADDRLRYLQELNVDERNILNLKILDEITTMLQPAIVIETFQFKYIAIKTVDSEDFQRELEVLQSQQDHNYFISPVRGNVATTFSIGLSSLKNRKINATQFIYEAEVALDNAVNQGGDQLILA